jgi:hypothetical protein
MRIRRQKPESTPEPEPPRLTVSPGVEAIAAEMRRKKMPAWGRPRKPLEDWPKRR